MHSGATSTAGIITGAETVDLQGEGSHGVLLLHGFGDTPQTLGLLARDLHAAGFGVRAPLLPGHGRTVESFITSRRTHWLGFANAELLAMQERYAAVSVAGLSMGGALAAILAARHHDISALVLLAPYVDMPLDHRVAAASHWIWGKAAGARSSRSPRSILDPSEREKNLGYGVYSGRLLYELWKVAAQARVSLAAITVPTLLIQSRNDPRVAPGVAARAYSALGSVKKRLVWTDDGGHIITVDYGRERVFNEVRGWLTASAAPRTTTATAV
ncbi:MAG: alpha/beta fold hydrolase [Gemmatimonadaceae bacterium]